MHTLILDFNLGFINPTQRLWPLLFKISSKVTFFGPGFQSEDVVQQRLARFISRTGPYDVVVASENIYYNTLPDVAAGYQATAYKKGYACNIGILDAISASHHIFKDFLETNAIRCLSHFVFDCYNMRASHLELLNNTDAYVIGWGQQFVARIAELSRLGLENFGSTAQNRWHDFVASNDHRMISLPTFISEPEFSFLPLGERRAAWSVAGSGYYARKVARAQLQKNGLKWNGKGLYYGLGLLHKVGIKPFTYDSGIVLVNHLFHRAIESARYSYTCGSGLQFPIRKFFEVPALGAVLVCLPCNGFDALGFEDGVNAIVSEPDHIMNVHHALEQDPDRAQAIADSGRELVWCRHSLSARAQQLRDALAAICAGRYEGSRWDNGMFRIVEKTASNE